MTTQTRRTVVLSLLSAIICGFIYSLYFIFAIDIMSASSPGHINYTGPIDWIPGILFGFSFGVINVHKKQRILLYVIASSALSFIAGRIFYGILNLFLSTESVIPAGLGAYNTSSLMAFYGGGALSGLFGAFALAIVTKALTSTPLSFLHETRSLLVGALIGVLFVYVIVSLFISPASLIAWPIAFALWHVSVGWSLTASIQSRSLGQTLGSEKLRD